MTRHGFIWSLLAMVLAPLGLRVRRSQWLTRIPGGGWRPLQKGDIPSHFPRLLRSHEKVERDIARYQAAKKRLGL